MSVSESIESETTALFGGRVSLRQPDKGFRVAIDSLLLAAAANPPSDSQVLDLGCGVGAAGLCLLDRRPDLRLSGLEIQPDLVALAARNIADNARQLAFGVVCGDAAALPREIKDRDFDWVISNPPYFAQGSGGASPLAGKSRANQESSLDLAGWLDAMLRRLLPGGGLTLVHRSDRLAAILAGLEGRCGAITVLPLWPKTGQPAKRVLVSARKGSRAGAVLLPGLLLHRDDGSFTDAANAVLRDGAALSMEPSSGRRGRRRDPS